MVSEFGSGPANVQTVLAIVDISNISALPGHRTRYLGGGLLDSQSKVDAFNVASRCCDVRHFPVSLVGLSSLGCEVSVIISFSTLLVMTSIFIHFAHLV